MNDDIYSIKRMIAVKEEEVKKIDERLDDSVKDMKRFLKNGEYKLLSQFALNCESLTERRIDLGYEICELYTKLNLLTR